MIKRYEKEDLLKAVDTCNNNGVVLYPTDTIWGLGCKMSDEKAFNKLYKIKGREESKKCILLFDSEVQLERHFEEIPEVAWQLIECSEKPLTLILDKPKRIPKHLLASDGSIAVRVVQDVFCQHLIQRLREPIVSTSANVSGEISPINFNSVSDAIKNKVDYIVSFNQEDIEKHKASTIIKLNHDGEIRVIRK